AVVYRCIFFELFSQKIFLVPCLFLNEHESKTPFAEVAEVGFFCFFFHEKKRKVLKVLWFWSALPTASQSTHFMNIKYSVLYFTWKLRRFVMTNFLESEVENK